MSVLVQASQLTALVSSSQGVASGETLERPEPGLARGRWEAPAWVFYAVAIATVIAGLCWAAVAWRARMK